MIFMHDDERRGITFTHTHTQTYAHWTHKSYELHIASMPNIAYTILLSYCTESQFHSETWSSGGKVYALTGFRAALTFENTSSRGIRSGLYGGRNTSRAPTPVMMSYTLSRWWILALSITSTDRGLFPSNGSIMGSTH